MSNPARSVFVFSVYLIGLGAIWTGFPLRALKSTDNFTTIINH